jgi:hypothetical protein
LNSSYHPGRLQQHEKKFSCDDPRAPYDIAFLLLPFLSPHPIASALITADLLSMGGLPVLMPCFPIAPFSGLIAAPIAAIAPQWMIRPEYPAAAFQ